MLAVAATAALGLAIPVTAQDGKWTTTVSLYTWAADTDTTITTPTGGLQASLPFDDAFENLDFAFMGVVEARRDRWSLVTDFARTDLSFSEPFGGPEYGAINADISLQVLNAYGLYRVREDAAYSVDVGAGLRWVNIDTSLDATPGTQPAVSTAADSGWIDPVVAARMSVTLSDRWFGAVFFDYGGFSSSSESYQVALVANYRISDAFSLTGGYRLLDLDHRIDGNELDMTQSGPVFGLQYRF